jgi:hypothetical protein
MKLITALIASLALVGTTAFACTAHATEGPGTGEMKKVCHPKKDKEGKEVKGKDGKVVEECKEIKVRKKLEGTDIPAAKK